MGKYLKQGFVRELEWKLSREEISYSKMVELMEEECIKNYKAETFNTKEMKTPMQELIDEMTYMLTEGEPSIYALREKARKLLEKER